MSFIHLDKSIITFHFKEILEDGHLGGPLTLVGLGALLLGPKLLSQPQNQSGFCLSAWYELIGVGKTTTGSGSITPSSVPTLSLARHSQRVR